MMVGQDRASGAHLAMVEMERGSVGQELVHQRYAATNPNPPNSLKSRMELESFLGQMASKPAWILMKLPQAESSIWSPCVCSPKRGVKISPEIFVKWL